MPPSNRPSSADSAKQRNDENELVALFSTLPELPRIRSAKLLSGGNTNGVFRCSVEGGETIVAKHYYAYSVLFPEFKLSLKRSVSVIEGGLSLGGES